MKHCRVRLLKTYEGLPDKEYDALFGRKDGVVLCHHTGWYLVDEKDVEVVEKDDNREENLELWSNDHGYGSRIEDKVTYALEIIKMYAPHYTVTDTRATGDGK